MTTITTEQLRRAPGVVRRAVLANDEIAVTFHSKLLARIVNHDRLEQERAELACLRAEVEALRAKLNPAEVVAA